MIRPRQADSQIKEFCKKLEDYSNGAILAILIIRLLNKKRCMTILHKTAIHLNQYQIKLNKQKESSKLLKHKIFFYLLSKLLRCFTNSAGSFSSTPAIKSA